MSVRIRFQGGPRAGEVQEFGNEAEEIAIGRHPERCQVVFPPDETVVGREHLVLRRDAGRWTLVLDPDNRVFVDGQEANPGDVLEATSTLQLGPGGPTLQVEIEDDVSLPPTVDHGPRRAGTETRIAEVEGTSRRNRLAVVVALVLAGVLSLWLFRTETRLGGVADLAELGEKLEAMEEDVAKLGPDLQESLRAASGSVYLVVATDGSGRDEGLGTAWAVGEGLLATNAHVAATFFDVSSQGLTLVARSNAVPPVDHVIEAVELHPGYQAFEEIWLAHGPIRESLQGEARELGHLSACDVALMRVGEGEPLAEALALADADALATLDSGSLVGYVGYPQESIVSGESIVGQPTPTTQIGHVTALSDFFLLKNPADAPLVQHSLGASGGASGSPIFDAGGRVVALLSGGNFIAGPNGRISTGVGVNYAQRVDLLRELLDGTVEERQRERTARWVEMIERFPRLQDNILRTIAANWSQQVAFEPEAKAVLEGVLATEPNTDPAVARFVVEVAPQTPYLFIALPSGREDIDMGVFDGQGALIGADEATDWTPVVAIPGGADEAVEVVVVGPQPEIAVELHVYSRP